MEIKVGDKVRVSKGAPRLYARGLRDCGFNVYDVDGEVAELTYSHINVVVPLRYLIKIKDEEIEEKKLDGITEETANNLSKVSEGYCNAMQSIADNFDWQKYTADLAKEIALKVANKYNDPKEAAEYAIKVSKVIAEGLKKRSLSNEYAGGEGRNSL